MIEESEIIRAAKDACIHEEILLRKGAMSLKSIIMAKI